MRLVRAAALLLLVLVACSGDEPAPEVVAPATTTPQPAPTPQASPSEPAEPSFACANQEAVATDNSLRTGGSMSGDVNGDGVVDAVWIHFDSVGPQGCQAFVVAESTASLLSGPLETWRPDLGLPMPTASGLYEIDGEPGLEVVVNMGVGASTQFVGVVTFDNGSLTQIEVQEGEGTLADGLFGFGGSVGHLDAIDCSETGTVVASSATPAGRQYRVRRTFLTFEGSDLVESEVEIERIPLEEIDAFPEYAASPFGNCSP